MTVRHLHQPADLVLDRILLDRGWFFAVRVLQHEATPVEMMIVRTFARTWGAAQFGCSPNGAVFTADTDGWSLPHLSAGIAGPREEPQNVAMGGQGCMLSHACESCPSSEWTHSSQKEWSLNTST
jgi:hypothetical protein